MEPTELTLRRSTASDLKLIKSTLKLLMTAAPEARQLVFARAAPILARQMKWFGNWIFQMVSGNAIRVFKRSLIPSRQRGDASSVGEEG